MSGCDEEEPGRAHASQDRRSKNHHILIPDARLSCGRAWKMQRRVGRGSGESCGVSMSVGAADSERCYDGGFAGCRAGLDVQSALLFVCVWCVCVWACMFGLAGCFRVPPKASAGEARGLGGGPPSLSCQEGQRIVLHSRQATSLRQEAIVVILRRKARLAFLSRQPLFGKNYKSRRRWKSSRVHGDSSLLLLARS